MRILTWSLKGLLPLAIQNELRYSRYIEARIWVCYGVDYRRRVPSKYAYAIAIDNRSIRVPIHMLSPGDVILAAGYPYHSQLSIQRAGSPLFDFSLPVKTC